MHSQILAVNSQVFAEMFSVAKGQQQDSSGRLEVPLPGDTYKDVSTALHYLYNGCTVWLASNLEISGAEDATSLARFAHNMRLSLSSKPLKSI